MINFKEEIRRMKPSLNAADIEDAVLSGDIADMSDILMQSLQSDESFGNVRGEGQGADSGSGGTFR